MGIGVEHEPEGDYNPTIEKTVRQGISLDMRGQRTLCS